MFDRMFKFWMKILKSLSSHNEPNNGKYDLSTLTPMSLGIDEDCCLYYGVLR